MTEKVQVTFNESREHFVEEDEFGCDGRDMWRITTKVFVDEKEVWSKTVETDDAIESVCGVSDSNFLDALEVAAEYGYQPTKEDYDAAGCIVASAA